MVENLLTKLGLLNDDGKFSITNFAVYTFILIVAARSLFAGAVITIPYFSWQIETIDFAGTLPLLFAMVNYHGKRVEINKNTKPMKVVKK